MSKEVRKFNLSDLTIGATCDFHTNVKDLIEEATPAALHIEDKMPAYLAGIAKLQGVVNRQKAFVNTRILKEADEVRDNATGVISNVVRAFTTTPVAEKRDAALRLLPALTPYKNIRNHEYTKETSEVRGMLATLDHPDNAPLVAILHLEPEVEALRAANQTFIDAFKDRSEEWADRDQVLDTNSQELILALNAQYADICKYINALALVMTTPAIDTFIGKLNGVVRAFAAIIDGNTSGGGSSDDTPSSPSTPSDPSGSDDTPSSPSDPSDPSDPTTPGGDDDPGTGGFMG